MKELAPAEDQGVIFGVVQAAPNSTLDQTRLFTRQVHDVYRSMPETKSIFQITQPTGGFGGMVTKPWSERKKTTQQLMLQSSQSLSQIAGIRVIPLTPPPLPGGGDFPVDFVIASAAEPKELTDFANKLVQKAFASGMFIYADADMKFDQPQAEVVFDRDKVRAQGVDLSQAGRDLSALLGGNYVNRFSIQGRSYKVIPQIKRVERLNPDQLSHIYVTGSGGKLVPLSTFAGLRTSTEPREAEAQRNLALVQYERAIQTAFRDVADALVQYQKVKQVSDHQQELVATLRDRSRLSYRRYQGGVDTLLNALDADRDLFDAELRLAQLRRDELVSVVQLYRALGGGWQQ
jgi:multidrug efflux pump